jgi:hypothetical protein
MVLALQRYAVNTYRFSRWGRVGFDSFYRYVTVRLQSFPRRASRSAFSLPHLSNPAFYDRFIDRDPVAGTCLFSGMLAASPLVAATSAIRLFTTASSAATLMPVLVCFLGTLAASAARGERSPLHVFPTLYVCPPLPPRCHHTSDDCGLPPPAVSAHLTAQVREISSSCELT